MTGCSADNAHWLANGSKTATHTVEARPSDASNMAAPPKIAQKPLFETKQELFEFKTNLHL